MQFNEYSIIWDKNYIIIYANDLDIYKIDTTHNDLIAFHNLYNSQCFSWRIYNSQNNWKFFFPSLYDS